MCSVATWLGLYRSFCFWESAWQYCCLPSQAMRCYDGNASERCCLKMYKIKMMKSLVFFESCLFSVWIAFWPSLVTLRALPCACMTAVILFPKEHTSKKSTKDLKKGWRLTSSCSPFHYTWAAGQSNMFTRILDRGLISQIMLAFPWPERHPRPMMSWLILCLGCA